MVTSAELMARGERRLQSIYDAIEAGSPIDEHKEAMLAAVEIAQIGRAFAREAAEKDRAQDDIGIAD